MRCTSHWQIIEENQKKMKDGEENQKTGTSGKAFALTTK